MNTDKTNKSCIVVLGMHRSGTSAMMGALSKIGIPVGYKLIKPSGSNMKGYFESKRIVAFNSKMLGVLGVPTKRFKPLPSDWIEEDKILEIKGKIKKFILNNFKDYDVFGIKDPRMCRLLPIWLVLFEELSITPHFVIIYRNPYEAISSFISTRNCKGFDVAAFLWATHNIDAEFFTRGFERVFVDYQSLLADPLGVIDKIRESLSVEIDKPGRTVTKFIDTKMKNHRLRRVRMKKDEMLDVLFDELKNCEEDSLNTISSWAVEMFEESVRQFHIQRGKK
jgi:hypothetical protein